MTPNGREKDAPYATYPREAKGVWSVDNTRANIVSIKIGRLRIRYELLTWSDGLRCALISGSISDADLTRSLFGEFTGQDQNPGDDQSGLP